MAGSIIDGSSTFYPVIAKETSPGSGKYVLSVQRSGQAGGSEMTYPGSTANGDYHEVEGMTTWPELDLGNAVMVSRGTLASPLPPEPVQIGQQQLLGRNTGNTTSMLVGVLLAANGQLVEFFDIETLTAAHADFVLTVDSITSLGVKQASRYKWKPPGVTIGTTAPATTDKPGMWLYDDTTNANTELYYYDPNRAKWLSAAVYEYIFDCTGPITGTAYFNAGALGLGTSTNGYPIQDDLVCVGVDHGVINNTSGTSNFAASLGIGGSSFLNVTLANDVVGAFSKAGQDTAVTASGGLLTMQALTGTSGTVAYFKWFFRKTRA